MNAEQFNATFPIGSCVIYQDAMGDEHKTKTRSEAWELGGGQVVVKIEGRSGGYDIGCIRADPTPAAEQLYFIRSWERGYMGNSPMWWGKNECGYTSHLDQAGRYTWEQCVRICKLLPETGMPIAGRAVQQREGDEPYRCEPLLAVAHMVVDTQDFHTGGIEGGK